MLEITHKKEDKDTGAFIVQPKGNLDIFTYQDFRKYLEENLTDKISDRVIIDLEKVEYVASSGWAVLLSQSRLLKRAGKVMVLCNMRDEIKSVYEVMNVETLLPSVDGFDDAVKFFESKGSN